MYVLRDITADKILLSLSFSAGEINSAQEMWKKWSLGLLASHNISLPFLFK